MVACGCTTTQAGWVVEGELGPKVARHLVIQFPFDERRLKIHFLGRVKWIGGIWYPLLFCCGRATTATTGLRVVTGTERPRPTRGTGPPSHLIVFYV